MWLFWLLALLPIVFIGGSLFFDRKVSYLEWLITTGVALATAGVFQLCVSLGMVGDTETWSGQVTGARQFSAWKEYYEYAVYRTETYLAPVTSTDSEGHISVSLELRSHEVFDHWEPTERWHGTSWKVSTTLGDRDADQGRFSYISEKFGGIQPIPGDRVTGERNSRMVDGDANDYVVINKAGWIEPVTTTKSFKNKVKAAPSTFSYCKVPTNVAVFAWPSNPNFYRSDRVMGKAKESIDTLQWDQMNAVLGPTKKVNLIIIGFGESDPKIAEYQESAWVGGKKNDLVICYGNIKLEDEGASVKWTKVFGWTESDKVKHNLEKLVKEHPINNDLLPLIADEVRNNYVIKDWSKFDNVTIEPPTWSYWLYFAIMIVTQGILFMVYNMNELDQDSDNTRGLLCNVRNYVLRLFGRHA